MQSISFTQLRTHSSQLKQALEEGKRVNLIHRSQIIGEIHPKITSPKIFNAQKMKKIVTALNLPKLTHKQMEENYRKHMEQKYGKYILGHK